MGWISGNFKRYIFRSDNLYTVGLFKVLDASMDLLELKDSTITFTGFFSDLNESDLYSFSGEYLNHERYGMQFNVSSYEVLLPTDHDKIVSFLSSNIFPTIGYAKASLIVDKLGNDVLNLIIDNRDILNDVPKLSIKKKNIIYDNLVKYRSSYEIILYLTGVGFNTKDALLIYDYYKDRVMDVIEHDPYVICDDIKEINFKKIDKLRSSFNILDLDEARLMAAIKYVIGEVNFSTGSTYLSKEEIVFYTQKFLFINDEEKISSALDELVLIGDVICVSSMYFISSMYEAEEGIKDFLIKLCKMDNLYNVDLSSISKLEKYFAIKYDEVQKKAIRDSINNNLMVITGGPGTGKTTIIKAICQLYMEVNGYDYNSLNNNLVLLAPTGRAAKRISIQTSLPAYTIHRFLKWQKESDVFMINQDNKSDCNFVIVDEASMLDTYLFYNLLCGLKKGTKILLIGDYNQLPSVGAGNVLKDIIDSDVIPVIALKQLYRQEEGSSISLLANAINNDLSIDSLFDDDLVFISASANKVKDAILSYVSMFKDDDYQVMAPIYKGDNGIDDINNYIQSLINGKSSKNEIIIDGVTFRENDKVLELVNMPDDDVYNGDIGYIKRINKTLKEMFIDFDNNLVKFTPNNYNNLKLGYVISVHKSQGSEFDYVILPILSRYKNMLYKKLIYTAVTRAKKKLILIGDYQAFISGIKNNREDNRKTNLKNILISSIK